MCRPTSTPRPDPVPELAWQGRAQGGWVAQPHDPHAGAPCVCDWTTPKSAAELRHRPTPMPDQSRYGTATTDPLGRNAPEWTKGKHGLPVRIKGDKDDA